MDAVDISKLSRDASRVRVVVLPAHDPQGRPALRLCARGIELARFADVAQARQWLKLEQLEVRQ